MEYIRTRPGKVMFSYSVWVGGGEINDYYLTLEKANDLAKYWKSLGYDEVQVEKIID